MRSKIFKSILSVAIAVLLSSLVIIIGVLYPYFGGVQESQLKDELNLAADATEQLGKSYLEGLDYNRYRLTWVDADGTVIFDSHADAVAMENHADREEIKEALVSALAKVLDDSGEEPERVIGTVGGMSCLLCVNAVLVILVRTGLVAGIVSELNERKSAAVAYLSREHEAYLFLCSFRIQMNDTLYILDSISVAVTISEAAVNKGCCSGPDKCHEAVKCVPCIYHFIEIS